MFDRIQVGVWSIVYLTIIVYSIIYRKEKKIFFPLLPSALTISWEFLALLRFFGFGHIVWFVLDCIIVGYNIWVLSDWKKRGLYCSAIVICTAILQVVFSVEVFDGMLFSSFVDDFIIAILYVIKIKEISKHGRSFIGFLRLIGDLFAWLAYMKYSPVILLIGVAVLMTNILYVCYSLELEDCELKKAKDKGKSDNQITAELETACRKKASPAKSRGRGIFLPIEI